MTVFADSSTIHACTNVGFKRGDHLNDCVRKNLVFLTNKK